MMMIRPILIFISIITFLHTSIVGQRLIWQTIETSYSFGGKIIQDNHDNYVSTGLFGYSKGYIQVTNDDGQVLAIDTILEKGGAISIIKKRDDSTLVIFTFEGNIFLYNTNTYTKKKILQLEKIQNIHKVLEDTEHYIITGNIYENKNYLQVQIIINKQTLDLVSYNKFAINIETRLFLTYNVEDNYFIQAKYKEKHLIVEKRDLDNNDLWQYELNYDSIGWVDLVLSPNDDVYILGSNTRLNHNNEKDIHGIVVKLSENGALEWEKRFKPNHPKDGRWDYKRFFKMQYHKDRIFLVGTDGFAPAGPISSLSVLSIDTNGNEIWDFEYYLLGEGSEALNMVINDKDEIIVSGTCGISYNDSGERAFIIKIGNAFTDTNTAIKNDIDVINPNPVDDVLIIQTDRKYKKYLIRNMHSEVIKYGKFNPAIDVSKLPASIYSIELKGKHKQVLKFVKN